MRDFRRTITHILIGVIIGVSTRYFVDYVYKAMRKGGLTPELPFVYTDKNGDMRQTDVYLLPFDGFPELSAAQVAAFLSRDLGIVVKTTGLTPIPTGTYDSTRKQHIADRFYESLLAHSRALQDCKTNTVFIGIIADDMYPEGLSWNYCFASLFDNGLSIVATDRLVPYGILDKEKAAKIYGERLAKLLKRVTGVQYFHHLHSADPHSLLYSPLMSVDELDRMSFNYN